jgi:hypothetical protein
MDGHSRDGKMSKRVWVDLGKTERNQAVSLGDRVARSGLYILGKPGMGKSALMVNLARQYIENERGLFLLDPHGETISYFLKHTTFPDDGMPILLNLRDREYSFGINLLRCKDITDLTAVTDTYSRAYNVFYKLWEDSWGPWLQLILQNTLWAFIENQEYTLADVPMFLNPRYTEFRKYILSNVKLNPACVDFWKYEFFQRRERDQQERVDAALTRINTLLTHPYIRHIIGQSETTIDFLSYLWMSSPNALLFNISANLPEDIKKFIGVILVSELLHAVRSRNELFRVYHYAILVDEFQNFASSDDFRTLITEGRKFGVSTIFAHQERFGQFAQNQKLMGATLAAANKVFFQLTPPDATEVAAEFTDVIKGTEIRQESQLVPSPHAIEDLWEKGHPNKYLMPIRDKYFWIVDLLRSRSNESSYVFSPSTVKTCHVENTSELIWGVFKDEGSYRATPQMIKEALSLLNKYYYDCMIKGYDDHYATNEELELMLKVAMKLGGIYGFFPLMEAYTDEGLGKRFIDLANEKIKKSYEENLRRWRDGWPQVKPPEYVESVPARYVNDKYIQSWLDYARHYGMSEYELERFIVWKEIIYFRKDLHTLTEIIRITANNKIDPGDYQRNYKRLHEDYISLMAYLPIQFRFGVDFTNLPYEKKAPFLELVRNRLIWQLKELQFFISFCFVMAPYALARDPVKVPSGVYDQSLKFERTQQDLINEKAIELSNLPRFSAYAKVLFEKENRQTVWTGKIHTNPLPAEKNNLEDEAIRNGYSISRKRSEIEEQIRQRQDKWRIVTSQESGEPPLEPPPPTSFR